MYFCFQMGVELNHFLTYQRAAKKLIIESFLKAQIPNVCCFSQFYIIVDLVSSGWWILGDGSGLWELVKQMSCTHTGYKLRDRVVCSSGFWTLGCSVLSTRPAQQQEKHKTTSTVVINSVSWE